MAQAGSELKTVLPHHHPRPGNGVRTIIMLKKKIISFYFMPMGMLLVSVCYVCAVSIGLKRALDALKLKLLRVVDKNVGAGVLGTSSARAASALSL